MVNDSLEKGQSVQPDGIDSWAFILEEIHTECEEEPVFEMGQVFESIFVPHSQNNF